MDFELTVGREQAGDDEHIGDDYCDPQWEDDGGLREGLQGEGYFLVGVVAEDDQCAVPLEHDAGVAAAWLTSGRSLAELPATAEDTILLVGRQSDDPRTATRLLEHGQTRDGQRFLTHAAHTARYKSTALTLAPRTHKKRERSLSCSVPPPLCD